jgi:WD40 repeat protein
LPGSWVAYAPEGQTLATGGGELNNAACIWDAESGLARLIGGHHYKLTALVYSPNGRRIVTGSADPACQSEGVIRCWDAMTGDEVFDFSGCTE